MTATNKNKRWILATIVGYLLLGFLIWVCCHYWSEYQRMCANYTALNSENQVFKNENGTLSTENKTLVLSAAQMKERIENDSVLKLQTKRFHKVSTVVQSETVFKIDTIYAALPTPIPCSFPPISDSHIKKHYSFDYTITNDSLKVFNLKVPDSETTVTGFKRKNMFSPLYSGTEVTHSNPNIVTIQLKTATEKVPGTSLWSKLYTFGLGALAGAAIK